MVTLKFSDAPIRQPLDTSEEYELQIVEAVVKPTNDKKSENLNVKFNVLGQGADYPVYKSFNLQPQSLWAVRTFLNAVYGEGTYTEDDVDFDENELVGQRVGATVKDNTYDGRTTSQPDTFFSI
jgi:hypothetical protein